MLQLKVSCFQPELAKQAKIMNFYPNHLSDSAYHAATPMLLVVQRRGKLKRVRLKQPGNPKSVCTGWKPFVPAERALLVREERPSIKFKQDCPEIYGVKKRHKKNESKKCLAKQLITNLLCDFGAEKMQFLSQSPVLCTIHWTANFKTFFQAFYQFAQL